MRFSPNKLLAWLLLFLMLRIYLEHKEEIGANIRKVFLLEAPANPFYDPIDILFFIALMAAVFGTMRTHADE